MVLLPSIFGYIAKNIRDMNGMLTTNYMTLVCSFENGIYLYKIMAMRAIFDGKDEVSNHGLFGELLTSFQSIPHPK